MALSRPLTSCESIEQRRARRKRRVQRGFTLLEVMVAMAILSGATAWLVEMWSNSTEKAGRAIDNRELREYAGAFFTKFIYEAHLNESTDGTMRDYGKWAELKSEERDRLERYRYTYKKTLTTVAGIGEDDSENLFGSDEVDETSTLSDTNSTRSVGGNEGAAEGTETGVQLVELILEIYDTGDGDSETRGTPILVLKDFVTPVEGAAR